MDSRQAYRGMEVGTAAPGPEARDRIPHHGVAFLDPGQRYGAGRFARLARRWIREIRGRGRVPLLVGGTGFFLRALTDPVFREPEMKDARRRRLRDWADRQPAERLGRWARRLDPELSRRLDHLDPQRAARTLELSFLSGRPLTWWQDHGEPEAPPVEPLVFALHLEPEPLRQRIRRRVENQLDEGWAREVRRLRRRGHDADAPAWEALGYGEVASWIDGELERPEAVDRIAAATWQYARRQRTWFRNQLSEGATRRLDANRPPGELADRIVEAWREARGAGREARGRQARNETG